jgi:hypothetical protein
MQQVSSLFRLNKLVINPDKTTAISFHAWQNKNNPTPETVFQDMIIKYKNETKFLGLHLAEDVKWNVHVKYVHNILNKNYYIIHLLKNVVSNNALRAIYFANFHSHLSYGILFWGSDSQGIKVFKLQKKVVRLICNVKKRMSCREWFKKLKILPMPCVYIMEMVYQIKINLKGLKQNLTIHEYKTQQRFDLQTRYCRTDIFKKSVTNLGTKLYNKLPNHIKGLENLKLFKKELKAFLLHHTFYSVDEYLSHG